jgi:hypothetical protein
MRHTLFSWDRRMLVTGTEMMEELARRGLITADGVRPLFEMPTVFQSVPTIVTYGTADIPVELGTGNARLDQRLTGNRG